MADNLVKRPAAWVAVYVDAESKRRTKVCNAEAAARAWLAAEGHSSDGSVAKRAESWRARYRDAARREHAKHFERRVDAERWLRQQTSRLDRGEWTDPALGKVPVGEYVREWLAGKPKLKQSTRKTYDNLIRCHILPTWERVPLSAVQHEQVAAWLRQLHENGLSASRTRQVFTVFAQALDMAVRARRIAANPARGVELPALPGQADLEMRALDEQEVWALAAAASRRGRIAELSILVLAWCGLRFGELAALRVRDVDLPNRTLRVERTLSEVGGRLVENSPKTKTSIRTVPMPQWLADELGPIVAERSPDERLLTAPSGGPIRLNNWRRRIFDPAIRAARLATQTRGDVIRPHDLRHTCASLHIRHLTPAKVLSEMLGHASVAFTLDRYGHLYPGDMHEYVDRLGVVALAARADCMRTADDLEAVEVAEEQAALAV
jgi:integrase